MSAFRVLVGLALGAFLAVAMAGCAGFTVRSYPSGAEIFLNGSDKGVQTPYTFKHLPSGTYEVLVSLEGFEDQTKSIAYAKGDKVKVQFVLHEKTKPSDGTGNGGGDVSTGDTAFPDDYNGVAAIQNGDVARARTDAINNAILAKLEEKFGPLAAQKERISNFDLYRGRLLDTPEIYKYVVRKEHQEGDMYYVKVDVTFTQDAIGDLPKLKLHMDLEQNAFSRELERLLIGMNMGMDIVNGGPRDENADIILEGKATTAEHSRQGNEVTDRCDASVVVKRRLSREPLAQPEAHVLGKPAFTEGDAERSAMNAAAAEIFKQIRDALIARNEGIIERFIIIRDVGDLKKAQDIARKIEAIEGITLVQEFPYNEKRQVLTLFVRMKIGDEKNFEYYLTRLRGVELKDLTSDCGVIRGRLD